ncbi:MAG: hypothetical protein HGA45_31345 [Chloroflexales bacterium]|nr:hypothetical protein [Chloroflexales bacterium]
MDYAPAGDGAAREQAGPALRDADELCRYGAAQLFLSRAARVQPRLELTDATAAAVLQICRLVEGMPLAIDLAAAWARVLTCPQIAGHVGANLDWLASLCRDVPERHRSVRAVFDQSWARLGAEERRALCRLAVFPGGLDHAAAAALGDLPGAGHEQLLAALVDRSLLRCDGAGRFAMHALVRRYAAGLPPVERVIGEP